MLEHPNETISCILCGGPTNPSLKATNIGVGPKGQFVVNRCQQCSSTVISPIPANLGNYYLDYHSIPTGASWRRAVRSNKNRLAVLNSLVSSSASILDIGAGAGAFAAAANQAGHPTYAIEQDENCRLNIESFLAGHVVKDLEGFKMENFPAPDVVTLWHVFEHIPDPDNFLAQISQVFPITTKIIIEVPNADSWLFKIMGKGWPHLDAPRHIFLPSKRGIELIAQKNGMKVSQLRNRDYGAWGAFSISHFGNRVGEKRIVQLLRRILQISLTPLFLLEPTNYGAVSTYSLSREI